jgi:hypothetical protein
MKPAADAANVQIPGTILLAAPRPAEPGAMGVP